MVRYPSPFDVRHKTITTHMSFYSTTGQVVIHSLSTTESYVFDMKRPMRTVAMEPNFGKRSTRAFVCGGLSGNLVLRARGWLGHRETLLTAGEGPIWQVRWRGKFIAWADDSVCRFLIPFPLSCFFFLILFFVGRQNL